MFNYFTKFDMVAPKYDLMQGGKPSYQTIAGFITTVSVILISCISVRNIFFDMILQNNPGISTDSPLSSNANVTESNFYFRIGFKLMGPSQSYINGSFVLYPPTVDVLFTNSTSTSTSDDMNSNFNTPPDNQNDISLSLATNSTSSDQTKK